MDDNIEMIKTSYELNSNNVYEQTKRGRKVTQVISISPDSTMKSVYDFKFN